MTVCGHFGFCGGCARQNTAYEDQLAAKKAAVSALLVPFYTGELHITPSPCAEFFRNKIELSFANQVVWKEPLGKKKVIRDKSIPLEFESALGFRLKGRWDRCVDVKDCLLFNKELPDFLENVRLWAAQNNLSYYDQRKHTGALRNIILRQSRGGKEGMAVLVTAQDIDVQGFADAVLKTYPQYNVLCALNDGMSDGAPLKNLKVLHGQSFITETLNANGKEIVFELSPQSFFQTNTAAANLMYERVREIVQTINPQTIYDLYGGAGSFSLTCGEGAAKCLCVESVGPAVLNGRRNAFLNNRENVLFFEAKVEDFLNTNKISVQNSLIILDPPRSGLHPDALKAVKNSGVKKIIYISCNPVTLAENLKELCKNYKVTKAECFDFFPHTDHVETLTELDLQ